MLLSSIFMSNGFSLFFNPLAYHAQWWWSDIMIYKNRIRFRNIWIDFFAAKPNKLRDKTKQPNHIFINTEETWTSRYIFFSQKSLLLYIMSSIKHQWTRVDTHMLIVKVYIFADETRFEISAIVSHWSKSHIKIENDVWKMIF